MATNQNGICIGQAQAAMLVVTKLDNDCTPLTGDSAQGRTHCFTTVDAQPNVDEGQEFGRRAANGQRCWYLRDCDRLKQWDLTLTLLTWDWELLELMTSGTLVLGSSASDWVGDVVGIETPGPDAECPDGASLEIYTKALPAGSGGICSEAGAGFPTYARVLFPFTRMRFGQITLDDNADGILVNITGFALPNPNWGTGPANNWEGEGGVSGDTAMAIVFSNDLPSSTCGYAASVA